LCTCQLDLARVSEFRSIERFRTPDTVQQDTIQRKQHPNRNERLPALTPPFAWAGTFRRQWPPGSPSPPYRTFPRRTAQRSAGVGICPLSTPLHSPPLSKAFFAGLSIGCSGGRGVPVSGPFCLQLFQAFTGAKANPEGVRTQTGANFKSMAHVQAFRRLSLHISFRADTLSCFHS